MRTLIKWLGGLAALAWIARSAIPPKDKAALRLGASRIIVGKVTAVYSRKVKVSEGTDTEYVALVVPSADETTRPVEDKTLPPLLYVHFRQAGKRPAGWSGAIGQNSPLGEGDNARLYLTGRSPQGWQLLEPNGWEAVE